MAVTPSTPPASAIPQNKWPIFIRAIAKFRAIGDIGLGDTIVHLLGPNRSDRFKKWFTRKFGRSCGCTERQKWLNLRYPYA